MKKKVSTDGFTRAKDRIVRMKNGNKYQLRNKWMIKLNECPHCGSKKTFHKERMKTLEKEFQKTGKLYDNVISTERQGEHGNTHIFMKKDLCLDCGRDWVMQVFCWEKLDGKIDYFNFEDGTIYTKVKTSKAKVSEGN